MTSPKPSHFIQDIVDEDLKTQRWQGRVHTRFPPEPNGYLHIGHSKSICLNFGLARANGGLFNLRFDDTNPAKEDQEYVDSIIADVKWLGGDFGDRLFFASDYFEQMYAFAVQLVKKGKAYVCDLNAEQMREHRGTFEKPGIDSPFRNRTVEENLDLLGRMRAGEFADGAKTLRAKIDMASGNINLRDPVMYRIIRAHHHRTGDKWCIYPSYDWAHGLEDSLEKITHSICTLEFENHRPLYDWFLNELGVYHPQQIEFARLNLNYTVMSKRKLLALVNEKHVRGWDDPRMPTISALRRRGCTPEALWKFNEEVGVTRINSVIDVGRLENAMRDDLGKRAPRRMAVLKPLKVVLENYPEGQVEEFEASNHPEDASMGTRKVQFSRELYIDADDFMVDPPKKFFRLGPGREVRLKVAGYFITCKDVVKNAAGEVVELICTVDLATKGGEAPDGRKVKGTIHWVSAPHAVNAEVRLFDRLFVAENPDAEGKDYKELLNPHSLVVLADAKLEPALAHAKISEGVQFERVGYFCADLDSKPGALVFNRTVTLKDSWAKVAAKSE
ncbi:MAG: glutamine--tRNA ligase/YqeY domain fusion protein [Myxococcaceae bacterium]|nr:glutamine--tRNA ligase/YqeY domain fusion protein [Myxococcaceae bacterium]